VEHAQTLLNGPIVVWLAEVSAARESLPILARQLASQEQARVARLRMEDDRSRFTLGRALIRECLRSYVPQLDEEIPFAYTPRGRPYLAENEAIHFSISHTHDLVAVAVTAGGQVGIDLEFLRRDLNPIELARRIFSEKDFHAFEMVPEKEKLRIFFRAWTRKEAYLKARGEGISAGLEQVTVSFSAEQPSLMEDARDPSATEAWRVYSLPLPQDYSGSLACDNAEKKIEFQRVHFNGGRATPDSAGQTLSGLLPKI
jgi:4'-phosphopantetheinyl transferase